MNEQSLLNVGEAIDQLINVDVSGRGLIRKLYSFAREKMGEPLALKAAKGLVDRVNENGVVFIATGWTHRPWISSDLAESDGPPGAATLARALNKAFNVAPVILVEEKLVTRMKKVVQAAGFVILTPEQATRSLEGTPWKGGMLKVASVLGFPSDEKEAKKRSVELVEKYAPGAVITVEKGGMNEAGKIHSSRGDDISGPMAKIDYLVLCAREKDILTVGVGDGGNEIGMGVIRERLRETFPLARKCNCPCEKGIAPETETHCLVTATVSNWGAYGIEACLAVLKQDPEVLHSAGVETRVLSSTAGAEFTDSIGGYCESAVDGMTADVHESLVVMLNEIVRRGIREVYGQSRFAR